MYLKLEVQYNTTQHKYHNTTQNLLMLQLVVVQRTPCKHRPVYHRELGTPHLLSHQQSWILWLWVFMTKQGQSVHKTVHHHIYIFDLGKGVEWEGVINWYNAKFEKDTPWDMYKKGSPQFRKILIGSVQWIMLYIYKN